MAEIRLATEADVAWMCDLSNDEATRTAANFATEPEPQADWLRNFRATAEFYPWLMTDGGFAKASPWKSRGAYAHTVETSVYVAPEHRGRGIGRALCECLLPLLGAQGYHIALAGIALPNDPSVRLHESLGMTRTALLEQVGWKFGRWWSVGYWQKVLRDGPAGPIRRVAEVWAG
ncbi:MAG: GNAT family N-acetyltransferase [Planctomycetota bacterium]|jgi:phosphinothricin acetyltransferase